jgi:hypothetical protein
MTLIFPSIKYYRPILQNLSEKNPLSVLALEKEDIFYVKFPLVAGQVVLVLQNWVKLCVILHVHTYIYVNAAIHMYDGWQFAIHQCGP